jgi:hypothetical protein
MPKFKAGDSVVFCRHEKNDDMDDVTIGKIYHVHKDMDGAYFVDDAGDSRYVPLESGTTYKPTKIVD